MTSLRAVAKCLGSNNVVGMGQKVGLMRVFKVSDLIRLVPTRPPFLVEWSEANLHNTPSYIASHVSFIESLPFDGMVINDDAADNLFKEGEVRTVEQCLQILAPLNPNPFRRFKFNFSAVFMGQANPPPELFDDDGWNRVVSNSRNYAEAIQRVGIPGIFLDNEVYQWAGHDPTPANPNANPNSWWYYPDNYIPGRSLPDYIAQAKLRGQQLMKALTDAYPKIRVVVLHCLYECCSATPPSVTDWGGGSDGWLYGAFFTGMMESKSSESLLVDGGETYHYRTRPDFDSSYQWRKYGMAAAETSCLFMTSSDKALWPSRVNFSFGVYDKPYPPPPGKTADMNSTIARTTVANALCLADLFVWHYSEGLDWWAPPGSGGTPPPVTDDWINAISAARNDACQSRLASRQSGH